MPHCVIPVLPHQPSAIIKCSVSANAKPYSFQCLFILFNYYMRSSLSRMCRVSNWTVQWQWYTASNNVCRCERCVNECDQIRMEKEVSNFWIRDYCYNSVDLTAFREQLFAIRHKSNVFELRIFIVSFYRRLTPNVSSSISVNPFSDIRLLRPTQSKWLIACTPTHTHTHN